MPDDRLVLMLELPEMLATAVAVRVAVAATSLPVVVRVCVDVSAATS